jgi:hypothetical protein
MAILNVQRVWLRVNSFLGAIQAGERPAIQAWISPYNIMFINKIDNPIRGEKGAAASPIRGANSGFGRSPGICGAK